MLSSHSYQRSIIDHQCSFFSHQTSSTISHHHWSPAVRRLIYRPRRFWGIIVSRIFISYLVFRITHVAFRALLVAPVPYRSCPERVHRYSPAVAYGRLVARIFLRLCLFLIDQSVVNRRQSPSITVNRSQPQSASWPVNHSRTGTVCQPTRSFARSFVRSRFISLASHIAVSNQAQSCHVVSCRVISVILLSH